MDRYNCIAWVDNVCQKFEDVCLEVDNIMREEIIGAAETQLQTMGASVTKFFSDIVDDVVPQYSAHHVVEEKASDLPPVQKSGVMAHKRSEISVDDGHCEKEPSFGDCCLQSCHLSSIRRRHLDSLLKQNDNDGDTLHEKSRMIVRGNPIKDNKNQLVSLDILQKKDSFITALSSPLHDDAESSDILEKKDSVTPASSSSPLGNIGNLDILEKDVPVMTASSSPLPLEITTESLDILERKDSVMPASSSPVEICTESFDILGKKDSVVPASSPPEEISTESFDILEKKDSVMAAVSLPLEVSTESLDILEKKDPVMEALSSVLGDDTETDSFIGQAEGSLSHDSSTLMGSCESEVLDIDVALNFSLAESTGDSVDDVRKVELETIQPSNKAKLDESCIMVDSSELCAVSHDRRRTGSDKKKLMLGSIFASRKKAQDWECDQSHLDVGWYQQEGKGLAAYDESELLDDGFSDSEWEII